MAALGGGFAANSLLFTPPPPVAPQAPDDPLQEWRSAYAAYIPADNALLQMANALSYLYLLPGDWTTGSASLSNSSVSASIVAVNDRAQFATLQAWLTQYPELQPLFDRASQTLSIPVTKRPSGSLVKLMDYPEHLHDQLLAIGASRVQLSESSLPGEIAQWQYQIRFDDVPYAMLSTLSEMFRDKPVFVQSLSVEKGSTFSFVSFEMNILLEGVRNERV